MQIVKNCPSVAPANVFFSVVSLKLIQTIVLIWLYIVNQVLFVQSNLSRLLRVNLCCLIHEANCALSKEINENS